MRIHYLQHVPFEGLAGIETWVHSQGHSLTSTRFYESGFLFPDPKSIDALIIMGGSMNLTEPDSIEWLQAETTFIKACIDQKKKVLGICLGAQLIARALGSRVYRGTQPEIGWFPVRLTTAGKTSGLFDFQNERHTVFHWHGDTFDVPEGAVLLADSEVTPHQAFLYQSHVLALQFHLEVTRESIQEMVDAVTPVYPLDDALPFVQNAQQLTGNSQLLGQNNSIMYRLLNRFFQG